MPALPWILLLFCCGCARAAGPGTPPPERTLLAARAESPVRVDGLLQDEVWARAVPYRLSPARSRAARGDALREAGEVRLAWDATHLYLGARLADADVVARGERDQMHHYRLGDVVELFLAPEAAAGYWELYATPAGRKSSFFLPGRRQLTERGCGLRVAAQVNGTLNDSRDRDGGWTVEMAVPLDALAPEGHPFGPGARWRILVARYNQGRDLPAPELSAAPQLPRDDFHLLEGYAALVPSSPPSPERPGPSSR